MSLTKADIANHLFDEVGLNKREAKEFVDAYFELIKDALEGGENVKLSGFGNFQLREKNQRPGRNPKTGEEIWRATVTEAVRAGRDALGDDQPGTGALAVVIHHRIRAEGGQTCRSGAEGGAR